MVVVLRGPFFRKRPGVFLLRRRRRTKSRYERVLWGAFRGARLAKKALVALVVGFFCVRYFVFHINLAFRVFILLQPTDLDISSNVASQTPSWLAGLLRPDNATHPRPNFPLPTKE